MTENLNAQSPETNEHLHIFTRQELSSVLIVVLEHRVGHEREEVVELLTSKAKQAGTEIEEGDGGLEAEVAMGIIEEEVRFLIQYSFDMQADVTLGLYRAAYASQHPEDLEHQRPLQELIRTYAGYRMGNTPGYMLYRDLQYWYEEYSGGLGLGYLLKELCANDRVAEESPIAAIFLTDLVDYIEHNLTLETTELLNRLMAKGYSDTDVPITKLLSHRGWQTLTDVLDRALSSYITDKQIKYPDMTELEILREVINDPYLDRNLLTIFGKEYESTYILS